MRILTTLAVTLLCTPAIHAQAPAATPTMGQKVAAAKPQVKKLNDAYDYAGAMALTEALLPAAKPAFDASTVRSADQSTRNYVDIGMAYFLAYQAADNLGQWEKGLDYLNKALELAKESVAAGKPKLTEARDDYKKIAGEYKEMLDHNAGPVAALKGKTQLEDYEEGPAKTIKLWEDKKAEGEKWASFFQYDLDLAARQVDDFQNFSAAQAKRIKDQQNEIAKFALARDKKIKDLDAEIAAYTVRPSDRSAWVEGVITAPAYMNSFTDKGDKIAFVHRLGVLDPENPAVKQALADILAGKSGVQPKPAVKAHKK